MTSENGESRHIGIRIDRPAAEVYAYASDPFNLPSWAAGLGSAVEKVGEKWVATSSPLGRVEVAFAADNDLGVLDHDVTLPSGEKVHNPVRVLADGAASEVVFTLRRRPGVAAAEFERDAAAVAADLARLKHLLEKDR